MLEQRLRQGLTWPFMKKRALTIEHWFYLFLMIHGLLWTILPTVLRYTLPLDAVEGTTWGQQLFLGYDKNPFLNAWLTELAVWLGGKSGWLIYGFGQLCVIVTFWAVWRLGKKIFHPAYALIAVMILEGMTNYNIDAMDFDDNVLQLALWALIISYFYSAIKHHKLKDWVLVGLFAGLAMMAKYFVVILFVLMGLFLLINPEARKNLTQKGLYCAGLIFSLIVLPHVLWLFSHDFMTVKYAFLRTHSDHLWINHLYFAKEFGLSYLSAFLLPVALFVFAWVGKAKGEVLVSQRALSYFDGQYLLWLGLGPFLFVLFLSFSTGMALHFGWGQPLSSYWGLLLVAAIQPTLTLKKLHRFLMVFWMIFALGASAYAVSTICSKEAGANYPAPTMARQLTQAWHDRYHTSWAYVIGPRFTAGAVSFYSEDRPVVYMDADPKSSFWINEQDLRKKGAIIIWDADDMSLPKDWKQRFPALADAKIQAFPWMRHQKTAAPVKIGVAFLPPTH